MDGESDRHAGRTADPVARPTADHSTAVSAIRAGGLEVASTVSGMPDEPTPEPDPAVEGEVVDATALEPDAPSPTTAAPVPPPPVEPADTGYTPGGVPTFDSVREKIETRYGTAIGAAELDAESPEGRTVEEQYDARQRAAAERLAQIRESMDKPEDESQ